MSVGGTSLAAGVGSARLRSETVWRVALGPGCSAFEPKPAWQTDSGCANRTNTDVSAVADPNTGVAVYDTYDAAGLAGGRRHQRVLADHRGHVRPGRSTCGGHVFGELPVRGTAPNLNDVTSGSNGTCGSQHTCAPLKPGYDGPTGLGTPNGIDAFGVPTGQYRHGRAIPVTSPPPRTSRSRCRSTPRTPRPTRRSPTPRRACPTDWRSTRAPA